MGMDMYRVHPCPCMFVHALAYRPHADRHTDAREKTRHARYAVRRDGDYTTLDHMHMHERGSVTVRLGRHER